MTAASHAEPLSRSRRRAPHIIDVLIEERAPKLAATPAWPLLRPLLYRALDYRKAVALADAIAPLPGGAALDQVSDQLRLKIAATGLERVPASGKAIVICNHPTGIADGIAVYDALKPLRPDVCFYANADAKRVAPRFNDILIPVEWVEAKRTREKTRATLQAAKDAFEQERCVCLFPAGRLARRGRDGQLTDPEWAPTAVSLARKYAAPILPIHVSGPDSRLFHFFDRFSRELRDVTLFHEMLNKTGKAFQLTVGQPIAPERLDIDAAKATYALKAYVERVLPSQPDQDFA